MRKYLQIVDRHKAPKGLRLANYFIDLIFNYIITTILLMIGGIMYAFISGISVEEVGYMMENMNPLFSRVISLISYITLMFLIETLTKGRSLGKLITGTKVIMTDGTQPTIGNYFARNIIRGIILIDQLSFLGENGLHDSWSNTRVVKIKDYETELKTKEDINAIGVKEIV